jgi:antitoxin VapB
MALSIKDPEADRLARELARRTGETLTEAVVRSLRERLERQRGRLRRPGLQRGRLRRPGLADELRRIGERVAALPVRDPRSAEEILDYDERGLPR